MRGSRPTVLFRRCGERVLPRAGELVSGAMNFDGGFGPLRPGRLSLAGDRERSQPVGRDAAHARGGDVVAVFQIEPHLFDGRPVCFHDDDRALALQPDAAPADCSCLDRGGARRGRRDSDATIRGRARTGTCHGVALPPARSGSAGTLSHRSCVARPGDRLAVEPGLVPLELGRRVSAAAAADVRLERGRAQGSPLAAVCRCRVPGAVARATCFLGGHRSLRRTTPISARR